MRHIAPSFAFLGLVSLSGLGLLGCQPTTEPPPDLTGATVHHYRITSVDLPDDSIEVADVAFDLDGDGSADNQLGGVYSSMRNADSLYEVEVPSTHRLSTDLAWMLSIYDGGDRGAGVRITEGVVVGDTALVTDDGPAMGIGPRLPGMFTGADGVLPFGVLTDALGGAAPDWTDAAVTSIEIESYDPSVVVARVGFALRKRDVDPVVLPNLSAFFTAALQAGHSDFGQIVDTDHDLVVTEAELLASPVFQGLMAPDVTLEPGAAPGEEALSLAFRVVATAP